MWTQPPANLDLQPHQVDVWRVFLDLPSDSIKRLEPSLSGDESQRAARFYFPRDRDRSIVAHASLRGILARYIHTEPHRLIFSANEYGKPFLLSEPIVQFNMSHSSNYALIAVAREQNVGIDIERIREDNELERIAARYFSQREVSELMALPPRQRTIGFFTCWTRKEAYIKAQGPGLSLPLESFDVSLNPDEPAILRATRPNHQEASRWILQALEVDSSYASAVAVEGEDMEFRNWLWNDDTSR